MKDTVSLLLDFGKIFENAKEEIDDEIEEARLTDTPSEQEGAADSVNGSETTQN